ncbi:hypothetical protein [Streptomyces sp. NPDC059122]|uniref:hypothetical protein n=1 Tax=Streptomyces sp. NPDC059122 TaxID=3346732 RepID=UPI0036AFCAA5
MRSAVPYLEAHRAPAPVRIKKALEEDAGEAAKILAMAKGIAARASRSVGS